MGFSRINILYSVIAISIILIGFSSAVAATSLSDQATWIQSNDSTLKFTFLEATIHVVIKNNNNHAEFFKISQVYSGEGTVSPPIDWKVISTNPTAIRMINVNNPGGDLGWEVDSGQTRAVTFTMVETFPPTPFFIQRAGATNTFWPVINDPGLTATWFTPDEINSLNPNLQLKLWQGHFFFFLKNVETSGPRVEGNVRAPIVPINSVLTSSNPRIDFISNELPSAQTAAWDVTLFPGQTKSYSYTYQWPSGTSVTPANTQSPTSRINSPSLPDPANDPSDPSSDPTSVPTNNTGLPSGLFIVGAIVVLAGMGYAKFLR
jgi:hypothetical protein